MNFINHIVYKEVFPFSILIVLSEFSEFAELQGYKDVQEGNTLLYTIIEKIYIITTFTKFKYERRNPEDKE